MNNILRIGRGKNESDLHGAVFPDMLPNILINSFSEEGNLIYDPFMGLGTTGISAIRYKRNWIGSEISEEFCELANKRLEPHRTQIKMF